MELYPGVKVSIGPPIDDGFYYDFEFPEGVTLSDADFEAHRAEDARAHQGRRGLRAHRRAGGRGDRALPRRGPGLQGRADRGPRARPGRGDRLALPQRPLHRPLPRPARAVHQADQGLQAHRAWPAPTGAATRHARCSPASTAPRSCPRRTSTSTSSASSRRGRATTASSAGSSTSSCSASCRPGSPFWQPNGAQIWNQLTDFWRTENVEPRLPGGAHADPLRRRAVEAVGPLGHVPRQHVLHRRRGSADGPQAHELPGAHPDLQVRPPLLPRPAHPLRRGGPGAPPRAQRHAARAAARAPHHPGRRPHLLHRGAGRRRRCSAAWTSASSSTRRSASSRAWSCPPGPRSGWAPTRCGTAPRASLEAALEEKGLEYELNEGDGAFYGPKIDLHMTDSIGRSWQLGTVQLDYSMPERFDLAYTGADNADHRPVMIHRALMGSFERFIGILIEHYAGEFPLWLAPVQALVLPIADRHAGVRRARGARAARRGPAGRGGRAQRVGRAARSARPSCARCPTCSCVGDSEVEAGEVAVRRHGEGDLGSMPVGEFAAAVRGADRARRA